MAASQVLDELEITDGLRDTDRNYVLDSWARSYRKAPACVELRSSVFFAWHRRNTEKIFARDPLVLIARRRDNGLFIYGYGVFERVGDAFVVHWLGVKSHFQKQRIASEMLRVALGKLGAGASELVATHRTFRVEEKALEMGFTFMALDMLYARERQAAAERTDRLAALRTIAGW